MIIIEQNQTRILGEDLTKVRAILIKRGFVIHQFNKIEMAMGLSDLFKNKNNRLEKIFLSSEILTDDELMRCINWYKSILIVPEK